MKEGKIVLTVWVRAAIRAISENVICWDDSVRANGEWVTSDMISCDIPCPSFLCRAEKQVGRIELTLMTMAGDAALIATLEVAFYYLSYIFRQAAGAGGSGSWTPCVETEGVLTLKL